MLTVCSEAQVLDTKICLLPSEIDYFISQDLTAKALIIDTTLMSVKIKRADSINVEIKSEVNDLKQNEIDLKLSLSKQKLVSDSYQKSYFDKCEKYDKKVKWNKIYKKIIIGGIALELAEVGLFYLLIK